MSGQKANIKQVLREIINHPAHSPNKVGNGDKNNLLKRQVNCL